MMSLHINTLQHMNDTYIWFLVCFRGLLDQVAHLAKMEELAIQAPLVLQVLVGTEVKVDKR